MITKPVRLSLEPLSFSLLMVNAQPKERLFFFSLCFGNSPFPSTEGKLWGLFSHTLQLTAYNQDFIYAYVCHIIVLEHWCSEPTKRRITDNTGLIYSSFLRKAYFSLVYHNLLPERWQATRRVLTHGSLLCCHIWIYIKDWKGEQDGNS